MKALIISLEKSLEIILETKLFKSCYEVPLFIKWDHYKNRVINLINKKKKKTILILRIR